MARHLTYQLLTRRISTGSEVFFSIQHHPLTDHEVLGHDARNIDRMLSTSLEALGLWENPTSLHLENDGATRLLAQRSPGRAIRAPILLPYPANTSKIHLNRV